jgi:hypothetical protein
MQEGILEEGQSMYASFRFLPSGPENITKEVASRVATFDYSVTGKYGIDTALLQHLSNESMAVKFHKIEGHQQVVFGASRIMLVEVLRAFSSGQGVNAALHTTALTLGAVDSFFYPVSLVLSTIGLFQTACLPIVPKIFAQCTVTSVY